MNQAVTDISTARADETTRRGHAVEITSQIVGESFVTIAKWIGHYTHIQNCKTAENKEAYTAYLEKRAKGERAERPVPNTAVAHLVTKDKAWLAECPSILRRNAGAKWFEAFQAGLKGVRRMPKFRGKEEKRSCYVTRELFDVEDSGDCLVIDLKVTKRSTPFVTIKVEKAGKDIQPPRSLWLTRVGCRIWMSFSYETSDIKPLDRAGLLARLHSMTDEELFQRIWGCDAGVGIPFAFSDGSTKDFTPEEKAKMRRLEAGRRRQQRAMARRERGGKNHAKARAKGAKKSARKKHIRRNRQHHIAKEIAEAAAIVLVVEDLRVKNMTRKPKAKKDPKTGKWLKNGRRSKAALTEKVLNVGWATTYTLASYKMSERGKLLWREPPFHSSNECGVFSCRHVDPASRTGDRFKCIKCGHEDCAHRNAARSLVNRFITRLRAETVDQLSKPRQTKKTIAYRRKGRRSAAEPSGHGPSSTTDRVAVADCGADVRLCQDSIGAGTLAEGRHSRAKGRRHPAIQPKRRRNRTPAGASPAQSEEAVRTPGDEGPIEAIKRASRRATAPGSSAP